MTSSSPPPRDSMLLYWQENQYDDRNVQIHGRTVFSVMALFSVVLFIAVLTLYIHRSCLVRDPTNLNPLSPPFTSYVGGGLDPAEIRSLPVVLCRRESADEEMEECCICLGGLEEGEKMKSRYESTRWRRCRDSETESDVEEEAYEEIKEEETKDETAI
ncbi:hypothetical protein HID58_053600 [Brassica napus]|uniref:Uncharacterized protein n=3 Tax=Brassica TaxID=3705 RepID=A0ABQ8AGH9_BRANA|nr:hypothetical protein HID58_053600 [Brassica napus]VDC93228.1 unnamed protein product [Brassica oleracea]